MSREDRHHEKGLRPLFPDAACLGVLAVLACSFLWPSLFGGKVLLPADMLLQFPPWSSYRALHRDAFPPHNPMMDPIRQYYPWRKYASEMVRRGEVPLWNPYMFCGAPFIANGQSAVFHPVNGLFYVLSPERAFAWAAAVNLFLAGAFSFWFGRVLGLHRLPCLVGAIAFTYCGFFVVWLEFPTFLAVGLWLPAVLGCFEKVMRGRSTLLWGTLCGAALGMQFVAGHFHVTLYLLVTFTAWVAYRVLGEWLARRREWRIALRRALVAAGALVLGCAIAGAHLLPVIEAGRSNPRARGIPYSKAVQYRLPLHYALTFLVPNIFGNPTKYNHWGDQPLDLAAGSIIETCGYTGVAPLILAAAALVWRRNRHMWFFVGLSVGGLLLAFGTPLDWLFRQVVPGYKQLTGIARAVYLNAFAVSVLAAMGAEALKGALEGDETGRIKRLAAIAAVAVTVLATVAALYVSAAAVPAAQVFYKLRGYDLMSYEYGQVGIFAAFGLAAAGAIAIGTRWRPGAIGLLAALTAADLFVFGYSFNTQADPALLRIRTESLPWLQAQGPTARLIGTAPADRPLEFPLPNLPMAWHLQDADGSDSLITVQMSTLRQRLTEPDRVGMDLTSPALDALGVRYAVTGIPLPQPPEGWRLERSSDMLVYANREAKPRAFITYGEALKVSNAMALEVMLSGAWRPDMQPLVEGSDQAASPGMELQHAPSRPAVVRDYQPNTVVVEVKAKREGWLILTDAYQPGWKAFVDRKPRRVYRADYLARAIPVSAGDQAVAFVFLPASFKVGTFLSCLGIAWLAGAFMHTWAERRRRRREPTPRADTP